ncbi:methionyl-tRNA formyltransferase [Gordonia sihwensis]|uniref:methionyl-tRNA formyltransferase n=1 Tax=Gordonia sihwensis TaxID=173559 RepID=UPI0005EF898E|nr:methionyl-tRNA formyltransferase [Gordonia sihwensis]KJR01039.1 methionyl-tRNA formyltransferase [Gordonia sihwensis]MBY4568651.1 methionyl-tRNA formyltransferase [Gordonia sihwensis]
MRLVFAGTPEVAVPTLQELLDSPDHEVVGVITRPDTTAGRGRRMIRSEVGTLADSHGIEVLTPRRMSDPEVAQALVRWNADLGVVVAYGGLIPQSVLDMLPRGWVNLHFSVLPAWRGAAPVQAAIAAGDEFTGASVFALEAGLDTGPVYGTLTERIRDTDTAGDLLERLSVSGSGLLRAVVDGIAAGELAPVPQDAEGVSHAGKITTDDARVRWDLPSHIIGRTVRAHTPAPGAWTMLGDARIKLGPVIPVDGDADVPGALECGALAVTKKAVFVGTASGAVRLTTVQAPGKKSMNAADWARGSRLDGTEHFA